MLQDMTWETFKPHLNETFRISVENDGLDLELTEVATIGSEAAQGNRQAFSLVFRGPDAPFLEQQVYPLEHEMLGRLDLFVVPVGQVEGGFLYEVVFT